MIRVFNHYFHAWTLRRILFDLGLVLVALLAVMMVQGAGQPASPSVAGAQVLSLAAGMFVVNTFSGLYHRAAKRSIGESCLRAALAIPQHDL